MPRVLLSQFRLLPLPSFLIQFRVDQKKQVHQIEGQGQSLASKNCPLKYKKSSRSHPKTTNGRSSVIIEIAPEQDKMAVVAADIVPYNDLYKTSTEKLFFGHSMLRCIQSTMKLRNKEDSTQEFRNALKYKFGL